MIYADAFEAARIGASTALGRAKRCVSLLAVARPFWERALYFMPQYGTNKRKVFDNAPSDKDGLLAALKAVPKIEYPPPEPKTKVKKPKAWEYRKQAAKLAASQGNTTTMHTEIIRNELFQSAQATKKSINKKRANTNGKAEAKIPKKKTKNDKYKPKKSNEKPTEPTGVQRRCSSCRKSLDTSLYSKSQKGKGSKRRCKSCVEGIPLRKR